MQFNSQRVSFNHKALLKTINKLTGVVPMVQGNHNDNMPEIVRVSQVVDLSVKESLWDAGNVEEERQANQEVHASDTRHQYLQRRKDH